MNSDSNASRATLSEANRSRVLQHLYREGASSRAQIATALDLTPAAVSKIAMRLINAGIIEENGSMPGSKNRRSIGLALDGSRFHIVGVKFARSLVEVGVFDFNCNRISLEDLPTVDGSNIQTTISTIHESINRLIDADPSILAIGMAVPGPYLRDIGRIAVVSSMQEWRKVNFIHEFSQSFPVPVFIEQDARAGALAESLNDASRENASLGYYLVGEGVGLGVIEDGRLVNGARGAATEIGHVSIDMNGKPCDCGNLGCLERYCSAVTIHEILNGNGLVPGSEAMTHSQACGALFRASEEGDPQAQAIVDDIGRYVGLGCVTIINAFEPRRIVIGDIVSQAGDRLLRAVHSVVDARVIPELNDSTSISISSLPTDATVCGAASVAVEHVLDQPSMFFDLG